MEDTINKKLIKKMYKLTDDSGKDLIALQRMIDKNPELVGHDVLDVLSSPVVDDLRNLQCLFRIGHLNTLSYVQFPRTECNKGKEWLDGFSKACYAGKKYYDGLTIFR